MSILFVHTTKDLVAAIEANERSWQHMNLDGRIATRQRWQADGWIICGHDECPPWDCRRSNHR